MDLKEIHTGQPDQVAKILQREEEFRTLMCYYNGAMMEIETKFKVLNESLSISHDRNPIETIKCRLKNPRSIVEKLQRKNCPIDLETIEAQVYDIAGVRVVCAFQEDVYLLAEFLMKQDDIRLVRVKDYIKSPKSNGYRSLHLIVKVPIFLSKEKRWMNVEIQLRTIAMDFWASLEHKLKYKKNLTDAEEIAAELRKCAEDIATLDRAMQTLRNRIEGRDC